MKKVNQRRRGTCFFFFYNPKTKPQRPGKCLSRYVGFIYTPLHSVLPYVRWMLQHVLHSHKSYLLSIQLSHKPSKCSPAQIRRLASQVDGTRLWETHLRPILIERLPGTQGSLAVQQVCVQIFIVSSSSSHILFLWNKSWIPLRSAPLQHITSTLSSLSAGWAVDLDSFQSPTPRGQVTFTNIVATLDPSAPRRLLLACHYDSKALPPDPRAPEKVFLGASDSAVPCAMILELVTSLDAQLRSFKQQVWAHLCFMIWATFTICS